VSIVGTLAAIQALNLTITGVATADTALYASFNGVALPLVETHDGDGIFDEQAYGLPRYYSPYHMVFYVAPVAQGQGIDQGFQQALALKDAALAVWNGVGINYNTLGGAVEQIGNLGGQGQQKTCTAVRGDLLKAGVVYWGFVLTIAAQEKNTL